PAMRQIAGCPAAAAVASGPWSSLRAGAATLLSRLRSARCPILSAWPVPDLEWMPGRLDRAGRTLQALPRLLKHGLPRTRFGVRTGFRKDHAPVKSWSGISIRRKVIPLQLRFSEQ